VDSYLTIKAPAEAKFTEKMSRFLAFAYPVRTPEEAKAMVTQKQKEYFDARHVCWAWMLGADHTTFYVNDNGEPSGTAGKPILGQINSRGLTNVVIIVVRYFGGIKLGTPGLIAAYREAARLAIDEAEVIECHEEGEVTCCFPYVAMNAVMLIAKMPEVEIVDRTFDNTCTITLRTRLDKLPELRQRLASAGASIQ
jgi:uncharacterized YigZ family protein